jgi:hypothetical protein
MDVLKNGFGRNQVRTTQWLLGIWVVVSILLGGILTSYHQPFVLPGERILALVPDSGKGGWRAIHLLSGSCGCSQAVMKHLLERHLLEGVSEEIVLVDGPEKYLPGSAALANGLEAEGFRVNHINSQDVPEDSGLRGVPLLVFSSPGNKVAYIGGYSGTGDGDKAIYERIRHGNKVEILPVRGCAIGEQVRRKADPFRLKYF